MKTTHRSRTRSLGAAVASLVLFGSVSSGAGAAEEARDARSETPLGADEREPGSARLAADASQTKPSLPVFYVPPEIGFPARRMGGGTRGMGRLASLQILAPDHLGDTTSEQPTLYWYLAEPTLSDVRSPA
jgi:hypothetical protein